MILCKLFFIYFDLLPFVGVDRSLSLSQQRCSRSCKTGCWKKKNWEKAKMGIEHFVRYIESWGAHKHNKNSFNVSIWFQFSMKCVRGQAGKSDSFISWCWHDFFFYLFFSIARHSRLTSLTLHSTKRSNWISSSGCTFKDFLLLSREMKTF